MWRFGTPATYRDIWRAKLETEVKRAQNMVNTLPKVLDFLPQIILVPVLRTYIMFEEWRINSAPAFVAPAVLISGMATVFLAFQVRSAIPFMRKWFMHRPVVFAGGEWRNCVTMFTSTVSAASFAELTNSRSHTSNSGTLHSTASHCTLSDPQHTPTSLARNTTSPQSRPEHIRPSSTPSC